MLITGYFILVHFLGDLKTPKFHSRLTDLCLRLHICLQYNATPDTIEFDPTVRVHPLKAHASPKPFYVLVKAVNFCTRNCYF